MRARISRLLAGLPPGSAVLPLRAFFGVTFVYAGLDKLLDPAFLAASGPGSIGAQLAGYATSSPLGPLVSALGLPYPVVSGLTIAILEIIIGLATLTGLAFRAAAAAGLVLSVVFWLTASWLVSPYYLGQDLPYAAGWLTLLLAGPGSVTIARFASRPASRRALIGALVLALVAVGHLATEVRRLVLPGPGPTPGPTGPPAPAPSDSPVVGVKLGQRDQIVPGSAITFSDPRSSDPGVLVRLSDGTFVAFDSVCPHAGCTVGFEPASGLLICPCHGATFDPRLAGRVLSGPTFESLTALPISIDPASGVISLSL